MTEQEDEHADVVIKGHRFTPEQWSAIEDVMSAVISEVDEYEEAYEEGFNEGFHMGRSTPEQGHKPQRQVKAFHEGMGQPVGTHPQPLPQERVAVRVELIREEFEDELVPALHRGDLVETVDACIDILYVVYGLMVEIGVDAEPAFDEVHSSNMSKFGSDGKAIIAEENDPDGIFPGRVKKGPNYFKPNIGKVLADQGWEE